MLGHSCARLVLFFPKALRRKKRRMWCCKKRIGKGGGGEEEERRKGRGKRKDGKVGSSFPATPHCRPLQGPFVHLSVMIAAYLGRVRTKTVGEPEVRGTGLGLLGERV
jgi:hypothetical protein